MSYHKVCTSHVYVLSGALAFHTVTSCTIILMKYMSLAFRDHRTQLTVLRTDNLIQSQKQQINNAWTFLSGQIMIWPAIFQNGWPIYCGTGPVLRWSNIQFVYLAYYDLAICIELSCSKLAPKLEQSGRFDPTNNQSGKQQHSRTS